MSLIDALRSETEAALGTSVYRMAAWGPVRPKEISLLPILSLLYIAQVLMFPKAPPSSLLASSPLV